MTRPRRKTVEVAYYEIGLSNGVCWRIDGSCTTVYEIEPNPSQAGLPTIRGPMPLERFVKLLEDEKTRRVRGKK